MGKGYFFIVLSPVQFQGTNIPKPIYQIEHNLLGSSHIVYGVRQVSKVYPVAAVATFACAFPKLPFAKRDEARNFGSLLDYAGGDFAEVSAFCDVRLVGY